MSWLADRKIRYLYRDITGEEIILDWPASMEDVPELYELAERVYKRIEMLPYKVNLTFKIQFERNGLVAYKYDQGDGKPRTVSATRENFERNMGNLSGDKLNKMKPHEKRTTIRELSKSVTTKGYQKAYKQVAEKRKPGVR
jgi:hypothetical protein